MFVIITSLIIVLWSIISVLHAFSGSAVPYTLSLSVFFLYAIGCIFAVYFFVSNLSKLTKAQAISMKNLNVQSVRNIELGPQQQRLSKLSSKYTMLFGFAILSTISLILLSFTVHWHLRTIFNAIDQSVNLWCIYLQFSFAKKHYDKCCGFCDEWFRDYGLKRTRLMVHNYSISKTSDQPEDDIHDNESRPLSPKASNHNTAVVKCTDSMSSQQL